MDQIWHLAQTRPYQQRSTRQHVCPQAEEIHLEVLVLMIMAPQMFILPLVDIYHRHIRPITIISFSMQHRRCLILVSLVSPLIYLAATALKVSFIYPWCYFSLGRATVYFEHILETRFRVNTYLTNLSI
jgi:hypothetical protein